MLSITTGTSSSINWTSSDFADNKVIVPISPTFTTASTVTASNAATIASSIWFNPSAPKKTPLQDFVERVWEEDSPEEGEG